jgi:hypothetical protein
MNGNRPSMTSLFQATSLREWHAQFKARREGSGSARPSRMARVIRPRSTKVARPAEQNA